MEKQKLAEKLLKLAEEIEYGEIDVTFTVSRGDITKAIVTKTKEVDLLQ